MSAQNYVFIFYPSTFEFPRTGARRRDCDGSLQSAAVLLVSTPASRELEHAVLFNHLSFQSLLLRSGVRGVGF